MSRPRLTPHQSEVLARIERLVKFPAFAERGVVERRIGSRGAVDHLIAKGYVRAEVDHGPRGGEHRRLFVIEQDAAV